MSPTAWAWVTLVIAGLLEVVWAIGLKYTQGFTRLIPSIITLVALAASMFLLARAARTLPIGTAYAVWVGIGALGAAVLGIFLFNESKNPARIIFLALLLVSILGLKLSSPADAKETAPEMPPVSRGHDGAVGGSDQP
jgi:quaternary ammonium compound-resistance protein SugE